MKRILLIGALIAPFFSTGVYAATCTDTAPGDGYDDTCAAQMRLEIPVFAVIQFPAAGGAAGSDLSVAWDGSSTAGTVTDTVNICIGTNSGTGVSVTATSSNGVLPFHVTDGTTDVAYTLLLNGNDLTDGSETIAAADATDLLCSAFPIPLQLGFDNAVLATTPTDGTTPFLDTVTITVAPQ